MKCLFNSSLYLSIILGLFISACSGGKSKDLRTLDYTHTQIDTSIRYDTRLEILSTIEAWRVSWENEELQKHSSFYANDAEIIKIGIVGGKEYRRHLSKDSLVVIVKLLNERYKWMDIKISGLQLRKHSETTVIAVFLQEFVAGVIEDQITYTDLGIKRLVFRRYEDEWKIAYKDWRMYEKIPIFKN